MIPIRRRLAARAPVPVYCIAGAGARDRVQDLWLSNALVPVRTPRAASILVVAGSVSADHAEALARVHDALPHPRGTLLWGTDAAGLSIDDAVAVESAADPVPAIQSLFARLIAGAVQSAVPLLPDVDPSEWRGVGPYGQGGSGMTGGTPYGRPMAELGPDRDGLRLDVLPTWIGPFFAPLPAGLVLDLTVAGDVVVEAAVTRSAVGVAQPPLSSPFLRALVEPVSIAEVELARSRDHLRWLADALRVQGLPALGLRALALAHEIDRGSGSEIRRLGRAVARSGVYRWSLPPARGRVAERLAGAALGPVSRAAGFGDDERLGDPAYLALGFEPVLGDADDAGSRWRVRIEEAARSAELAAVAGDAHTSVTGVVESPRGRLAFGDVPTRRALDLVPDLITGLEWGDAIASIVSLDLDLDDLAMAADGRPGVAA